MYFAVLLPVTCKFQTLRSVLKNKIRRNQTLNIISHFDFYPVYFPGILAVFKRCKDSIFSEDFINLKMKSYIKKLYCYIKLTPKVENCMCEQTNVRII